MEGCPEESHAGRRDRHDGPDSRASPAPARRSWRGSSIARRPRKNGPFVAINCAALPEQLLESELFGYERGAFTGAQQAKPGQIELAAGGVLFLDEVSEMSLSAQAKFLRVLQEREFQRLGGTRPLQANVRVIAATNRDLRKAVDARRLPRRPVLPAAGLRHRDSAAARAARRTFSPLAEALLEEIGRSIGRPPGGLTREAHAALLRHDWPGNVRELRNALERAAILCEGGPIDGHHLMLEPSSKLIGSGATDLNSLEREVMARVLRECNWQRSNAARRLGLSRTQLYSRIHKHGLEPPVPS